MKFIIYEDPTTHQCAHLPLPSGFLDGDPLPAVVTDRWFESREAAVAALAELLDHGDGESSETAIVPAPAEDTAPPRLTHHSPRPVTWRQH